MVFVRYETRFKAGEALSEVIKKTRLELFNNLNENPDESFCFTIPNGGVPIAEGFCSRFDLNYDLVIVRKIKIPWNTEAGFGSITTDGTVLINQPLFDQLNLTDKQLENSIDITKKEIQERLTLYNKEINLEENYEQKIQGKQIFMMDDGLASGFTMMAAIKMIKNYKPKKIFIAVPTAPLHTVQTIEKEVDYIFCPNVRDVWRFAVADAYKKWYDVPETEVLKMLRESKYYLK
jgi:predicted phosphoribosyltransferase